MKGHRLWYYLGPEGVRMKATLICGMIALWCVPAIAAPGRRPITETDLVKFRWISDPRISPDGREIAYVLVTVDENEDRYNTSIWTVAASGDTPQIGRASCRERV